MITQAFTLIGLLLLTILTAATCEADGIIVDKVYHPNVVANESEFEWRFSSSQTDSNNRLAQQFGYGYSLFENVAFEAYIIAERDETGDFNISGYEGEIRWMLTEQGQYWADWGALFEFEVEDNTERYEATAGLLFEKEFSKTSLTMNALVHYEWGQGDADTEAEFRMKYRYRYTPAMQPAVELYMGKDFVGIGPALMGVHRFDGQKQIKWEAGFITEITQPGKDHTLRLSIEYEF
jgi:hypothetical protein